MKFCETTLPGCYLITPTVRRDERGTFVKTLHVDLFTEQGLACDFVEEYYSTSNHHVLRGMHFQLPPHEHTKLVYCTAGSVLDVVLDLRRDSPSYGKYFTTTLDATTPTILYIPKGLAHGFLALEDNATLVYKTSTVYAPDYDTGILWNSFGFDWPVTPSQLSARDQQFMPLNDFDSPFIFSGNAS